MQRLVRYLASLGGHFGLYWRMLGLTCRHTYSDCLKNIHNLTVQGKATSFQYLLNKKHWRQQVLAMAAAGFSISQGMQPRVTYT